MPLGCNPEIHRRVNLSAADEKIYGSDISFVGTLKFDREKILVQLSDLNLGLWGYWPKKSDSLIRFYRNQYIYGEGAIKIYNASKIILDIGFPEGAKSKDYFVTARVFEIPACGAFLLTRESSYLKQFYEVGKELVCYRDEKELRELIEYYLAHPAERSEIAGRGQARAYRDHTYEKRLKEMFSIILKNG